ncbi:MAG: glycosyl hydrolase 108 family protein, partial [Aurantimonas coralicida]
MSAFDECLALVLVHEGGYANHPKDPGEETNTGITRRVYDDYRTSVGKHVQSVRHITDGEVAAIYRTQYWNACAAPQLPRGVDYGTFDGSVNSGVPRGEKWLQAPLGIAADGKPG